MVEKIKYNLIFFASYVEIYCNYDYKYYEKSIGEVKINAFILFNSLRR